jgi:ribose/xylose/arabinose/galactoside ABC-type transport system permease subunit
MEMVFNYFRVVFSIILLVILFKAQIAYFLHYNLILNSVRATIILGLIASVGFIC